MNELDELQKALDQFPKWHDWKDNPYLVFNWINDFKGKFAVFRQSLETSSRQEVSSRNAIGDLKNQGTFFAKELSLRKLVDELRHLWDNEPKGDDLRGQWKIRMVAKMEELSMMIQKDRVFDETFGSQQTNMVLVDKQQLEEFLRKKKMRGYCPEDDVSGYALAKYILDGKFSVKQTKGSVEASQK